MGERPAPHLPRPQVLNDVVGSPVSRCPRAAPAGDPVGALPARPGGSGRRADALPCGVGDRAGRDAELLVEALVGGGRAEVLQAHRAARVPHDVPPALGDGGLDADSGPYVGRQHRVLVGVRLLGEPLTAGQRDHACVAPLGGQQLPCFQGDMDLRPGPDEDHVRRPLAAVGEYVPASGGPLGGGVRAVSPLQDGQRLPGQGEAGGPVVVLQDGAPADGRLVGVGGPYDVEAGDRAEGGELLDGLVGGAVLAQTDGVMGPDVGDRELHQGGEPDGRAHVVAEDQERTAVGAGEALQGDAVEDRAHGVLTDAEVERAAVGVAGELAGLLALRHEGRLALHGGVVAPREVGRAAPQLGQHGGQRGEHVAGRLAGGDALGVRAEDGQAVGPALRKPPFPQPVEESGALGVGGAPLPVAGLPGPMGLRASLDDRAGVMQHVVLDGEAGVRVEAEQLLGGGDLLVAERGAMGLAGVLFGGRGPADDRAQQDQEGRPRSPFAASTAASRASTSST